METLISILFNINGFVIDNGNIPICNPETVFI